MSDTPRGTIKYYPFDVDNIKVAESAEEIKRYEQLMETKVKSSRFSIDGARMGLGITPYETTSESGGRDDECDEIWL